MDPTEGRRRVVIEGVVPLVDGGRFPIKRVTGERVVVEADVFADGHDQVECRLLFRRESDAGLAGRRHAAPRQRPLARRFRVEETGRYRYTIEGWIGRFATWRADLAKRLEAGQDISIDLLIGAELSKMRPAEPTPREAERLRAWARQLREPADPAVRGHAGARRRARRAGPLPSQSQSRDPVRHRGRRGGRSRVRARFSTWYELFPRSCAAEPGRHGTLRDVEARLPYVAEMGFDVLYLPPIHPIGRSFRKGRTTRVTAEPGDVGSPWAIGANEGGHTAIHPELGTLEDFD